MMMYPHGLGIFEVGGLLSLPHFLQYIWGPRSDQLFLANFHKAYPWGGVPLHVRDRYNLHCHEILP
ncbi:hypothetical protein Hanom_Chr03g00275151 [Helianthus anomalus]